MERDFERLRDGSFDLLVIGGGIYGAWTAYDAALRGLRVALVERRDWASGTSSASSKLIHGGLRYLRSLQIGQVRKSLLERRRLRRLGPHRVHPLRFVLPLYARSPVGRLKLKTGLWLYDRLASHERATGEHHGMGRAEMLQRFELLEPKGLHGGFTFGDCRTDDARFTLEIVDGAAEAGAVAVNHAAVIELRLDGGRVVGAVVRDEETGATVDVDAQVTACCTGAWSDRLIGPRREGAPPLVRFSKGVHLVMPPLPTDRAFMLLTRAHGGVAFMIPWYGRTLLGTTDTEHVGEPEAARVDDAEVDYLLAQANAVLRDVQWDASDIGGRFVGLRTFPAGRGGPSASLSRAWQVEEPLPHLFVSVGGKFTGARADAAFLVHKALGRMGRGFSPSPTLELGLPWRPQERYRTWIGRMLDRGLSVGLDEETSNNCLVRYGSRAERVFELVAKLPQLAERVVPEAPFCLGEVVHAAKNEMARTLEDVFVRRVPLMYLAAPPAHRIRLAAQIMARRLGWSDERRDRAVADFCATYDTDDIESESTETVG
jgi:glycerol-3-phosphate dehydrogenase